MCDAAGCAFERQRVGAGAGVMRNGDGDSCLRWICAVEGNGGRRNRARGAARQAAASERNVVGESAEGRDGYGVGAGGSASDGFGRGRGGDGEVGDGLGERGGSAAAEIGIGGDEDGRERVESRDEGVGRELRAT